MASLHVNGNGDEDKSSESSRSSSSRASSWYLVQDNNAVIDIGDDDLQSEGTLLSIDSRDGSPHKEPMTESDFIARMKERMAQEVGGYVWEAGKHSAQKAWNLYGNIDILRPYFDVEPSEVRSRLINSMIPRLPSSASPQTVVGELYGPLMLVFTLIAVLQFSMKSSGHTVQEGTLMGTACGVCFGYWFGAASLAYCLAYVCNTHLTLLQLLSLIGYGLLGHCLTILLSTIAYHHSHHMFYTLWLFVGGLSSLRIVSVFASRTWNRRQGIIAGTIIACIHLIFLLYLHFAYHSVYEEIPDLSAINHPARTIRVEDTGANFAMGTETVKYLGHKVTKRLVKEAPQITNAITQAVTQNISMVTTVFQNVNTTSVAPTVAAMA